MLFKMKFRYLYTCHRTTSPGEIGQGCSPAVNRESGVALIETIIVLPLFLILVFFFIWLGSALNAKAALTSAVGQAVRLAITRGNEFTIPTPLFAVVDEWQNSTEVIPPSALTEVLCHGIEPDKCITIYQQCTYGRLFGIANVPGGIRQVPREYLYAMIYLNEAMRQSLGGMVKFPCKPDTSSVGLCPADIYDAIADAPSGEGCMLCIFLDTRHVPPMIPVAQVSIQEINDNYPPKVDDPKWLRSKIGIECGYHLSATVTRPLQRLLGAIGGGDFVLTTRAVYQADELSDPSMIF